MVDEILSTVGIPAYIVTKYGIKIQTKIFVDVDRKNITVEPRLYWRENPRLGCDFSDIKSLSKPVTSENDHQITLLFSDLKLILEIPDAGENLAIELYSLLSELLKKSQGIHSTEKEANTQKDTKQQNTTYQQTVSLRNSILDSALKEEQLIQLCFYLRYKEAYMTVEKSLQTFRTKLVSSAFKHWINVTKDGNTASMCHDRTRWRLHATANQDIDLQAWYHALFYQEVHFGFQHHFIFLLYLLQVYRLRGHFWYKDAVLPVYKQSYDLIDNALTPLEEAALAHVLCSPDTSYGDVAGQMFVVQALISPRQFTLFQQLAAQGAQVIKYPRSGRPAKKLFRFSFVEGNIYLTWKGKFGNQGVGMSEVTSVVGGIQTDVLKWSAQPSKAEQYLSVLCSDRSVDLFFDSEEERNNWRDLLRALVTKEQGTLTGIESVDPPVDAPEFEWLTLYASIGKKSE